MAGTRHGSGAEPGATVFLPVERDLPALRQAAARCRGCELWHDATQVVFSSGSARARLVLVGEQPGDREDRVGEPFVGPAGRLLDEALEAAGIERSQVYLTNAVKHFRHHVEPRGKRRIHDKPAVEHIVACRPWLEAELAQVSPRLVVCLGATAARSVLGRPVAIGRERGTVIPPSEQGTGGVTAAVLITTHPSALVRLRGKPEWEPAFDEFVADLETAARAADDRTG